ncbi:putative TIM-barrel fold metal-dependent hydrolase [Lysinibacillus composti]|uniref:2-pyrone-4,6-dicarboxylate hydrolase n=1 Tax=Lysinibacillus composti TaxID=720633 RepID=A0A3N9UPR8_9BACI|nr:2-pyrone-4,6-dicarboxylate hydrolase [Lysinibacillus composti]MBM7608936.1 putative TIM-barrel fold metal-dependent hydrolase [Lysinibacillus composti]RQW74512.1 2-pyrone-4,6-dicarboxylate hydrolase [Lysinibacillus composti]
MQKIFDAHFHIIDPKFPLVENQGFVPDYYTVNHYLKELKEMSIEVTGGAIVSGSFQGYHQDYFAEAISQLGKNFVGITQLPFDTTDEEIFKLNDVGIKGIRFNLYRGLSASPKEIKELSEKVNKLCNWKTELYLNLQTIDSELEKLIFTLPKVSIDHLGMHKCSIDQLKKIVNADIPIRLTGFGRIGYERDEVRELIPILYRENPSSLMFGSDLPSTRANYRFSSNDIELIKETVGKEAQDRIFFRNGEKWYLDQ